MSVRIIEMSISDYDLVCDLWRDTPEIQLSEIDTRDNIIRFLDRNPGFSHVAWDGELLVGAVLCSHDGRRGYIDHLVVRKSHRQQGVGRALVLRCLYNLMRVGIRRWNLYVLETNQEAIAFWKKIGWSPKLNAVLMTQLISQD